MSGERNGQIRYDILGELCRARRAREGLSLRATARLIGISASTLSRLERAKHVEIQHVLVLSKWLDIKTDRLFGKQKETTPQAVKAILLNDSRLGKDEALALAGTFSVLYRQMAQ